MIELEANLMAAGVYTLVIEQGATLAQQFVWKTAAGLPIDLTGHSARAKARAFQGDATVIFDLTTANGGITLGGATGTVTINLTAAATAALNFNGGEWDLEVVSAGGIVTRLLKGQVTLDPEITV
ncbi:MAG: hypothetical protein ABIW84_03800 [Ilumatobacteraceae bacterium]